MDKLRIKSAQEALALAKKYLAGLMQDVDFVKTQDGKVKWQLANFYTSPDYRKKIGGVCFVFYFNCHIQEKVEEYRIYIKCSGIRRINQVKGILVEESSLEEIMPGDNFSSLGERYHYDGNEIFLGEKTEPTGIH